MDIFTILLNLYVNKDRNCILRYKIDEQTRKKVIVKNKIECNWIQQIENTDVQPFVIQLWLSMNDSIRTQVRWLDRYVFVLPPKMYLSLAWSVLPKSGRVPFSRYIKKLKKEEEFDFILPMIRKQYQLSDNDYKTLKPYLLEAIKEDMVSWFKYYGVEKRYWKKYQLDFRQMKQGKTVPIKGLGEWGL